jgi:gamma-glutamylcyclotransferase (GGCT)/AIG2-like uncharacterized protein YtfP
MAQGQRDHTQERLPVFVYGTLRPGQRLHRLVADAAATTRPAVLPGHQLYGTGMAFPYVTPATAGGRQVVGDLLDLDPDQYPEVLERLDGVEGYRPDRPENHCHYLRQKVTVLVAGQPHQAWVYLAGPHATQHLTDAQLSPTGDWLAA